MNSHLNFTNKKLVENINLIFCVFVSLIPFLLITGPFLPDLLLVITGLGYIIIRLFILKDFFIEHRLIHNKILYFFIAFNIYLIFRSLLSENIYLSLESSLFYFRFMIFILAVNLLIAYAEKFIIIFTIILLLTILFVCLDSIFQLINNHNFFGIKKEHPFRVSGVFGEEYKLGSYIARLLPLLIGLIFYSFFGKLRFILVLLVMTISYVSIFISGERSAILITLFGAILMFLLLKDIKKIMLIASSFFGLSLIYIYYFFENVFIRAFDKTIDQMNLHNLSNFKIFSAHHESIYTSAILIFKDNVLFGIGPKLFREECSKYGYSCSTHPHNYYLQFLAELGLVGFSFLTIAIFYICFLLLKTFKNKKNISYNDYYLMICCIICFFINMFPFVPSGNFFNNWLSVLFFLPVVFIYNMQSKLQFDNA